MQIGRQLKIIEHSLYTQGSARHFIYFYFSNVHNLQSRYFYPHSAEEETNLEGSYDVPRATEPVRIQKGWLTCRSSVTCLQ